MLKANKFVGRLLIGIMAFTMLCTPITVYAGTDASTDNNKVVIPLTAEDATNMVTVLTDAYIDVYGGDLSESETSSLTVESQDDASTKVQLFKTSSNYLYFSVDSFNEGNTKKVEKVLTAFVKSLKDSSISDSTQNEIMNQIQDSDDKVAAMMFTLVFSDTKADIFTAYKWLKPLLDIVNVLLGMGAVVVIIFAITSTVIDLAYIGLPMWREEQMEKSQSQGKKKPFGVSHEALSTVTEVEKDIAVYKNAYFIYAKRRAIVYIVLSVSIMYLVGGGISSIIGWVLNLSSGIV